MNFMNYVLYAQLEINFCQNNKHTKKKKKTHDLSLARITTSSSLLGPDFYYSSVFVQWFHLIVWTTLPNGSLEPHLGVLKNDLSETRQWNGSVVVFFLFLFKNLNNFMNSDSPYS